MGTFYLPASLHSTRFQRRVWWFSFVLTALLLYISLCGLLSPVVGAQKHGCAPEVPPAVTNPTPAQALPGNILINEALAQPKSNWNCSEPSGIFSQEKDSWIEFYNPQNQAIDLYAAHAQISLNGGSTSVLLPFGSAIAAHGFLIVFPQEHQITAPPSSWNLVLSIDGTIIDQAAIPLLQPDQSYARVPDGTTTWLYSGSPTIDSSNNASGQPATPTPTRTSKPTGTVHSAGSAGAQGTSQPTSLGTQPAWGQVKFPANPMLTPNLPAAADAATSSSGQPQKSPTPQSNGLSGWSVALIVFFLLLLVVTLIWCWRLFRSP
jgi:hypothetical protein